MTKQQFGRYNLPLNDCFPFAFQHEKKQEVLHFDGWKQFQHGFDVVVISSWCPRINKDHLQQRQTLKNNSSQLTHDLQTKKNDETAILLAGKTSQSKIRFLGKHFALGFGFGFSLWDLRGFLLCFLCFTFLNFSFSRRSRGIWIGKKWVRATETQSLT